MRGYSDAPHLTTSESSPWLLARRSVSDGRFTVLVLFLPPALLLFTLFVVLPIGEAAWYSGFNWNGFGRPTNWIGNCHRYTWTPSGSTITASCWRPAPSGWRCATTG